MSPQGTFPVGEPGIFRITDGDPYASRQWVNFGLKAQANGLHELRFMCGSAGGRDHVEFTSGQPVAFKPGLWYHVALVYTDNGPDLENDGVLEFYMDSEQEGGPASRPGALVGRVEGVPDMAPFDGGKDGFYEVGAFTHEFFLNGYVDEVRWSNVARGEFNLSRSGDFGEKGGAE